MVQTKEDASQCRLCEWVPLVYAYGTSVNKCWWKAHQFAHDCTPDISSHHGCHWYVPAIHTLQLLSYRGVLASLLPFLDVKNYAELVWGFLTVTSSTFEKGVFIQTREVAGPSAEVIIIFTMQLFNQIRVHHIESSIFLFASL